MKLAARLCGSDRTNGAALALLVFAGSIGCNAIFGLDKSELGDPFGTDASAAGSAGTAGGAGAGGASGSAGTAGSAGVGGVSGSAGAAGNGGTAGAGGGSFCASCGQLEECFNNELCVAKLVPIPGGYSIDATEVTQAQYASWRAKSPQAPPAAPNNVCSWKTSYRPESGTDNYPVVSVDWCDAFAYCKGVKKRLCGLIGGGPADYGSSFIGQQDQWYKACTSGGANAYPYGNTYDGQKCNGASVSGAAVPVGSMTTCQSAAAGYAGVFDLSGNVWEWEDSCTGAAGATDTCHVRGGAFSYGSAAIACIYDTGDTRNQPALNTGFRCCSDP